MGDALAIEEQAVGAFGVNDAMGLALGLDPGVVRGDKARGDHNIVIGGAAKRERLLAELDRAGRAAAVLDHQPGHLVAVEDSRGRVAHLRPAHLGLRDRRHLGGHHRSVLGLPAIGAEA
jgi:hypothetical protein